MRRKRIGIPVRILAIILTIALFFGDGQILYTLATSVTGQIIAGQEEKTSETVTGGDAGTTTPEDGDTETGGEECEHDWVTDPETSAVTCSKCGIEKPEEEDPEECEHDWVTDPETSVTICSICGIEKPEEECEHDWVTDPETSVTTCSICGIEKPEEECEHEWVIDAENAMAICSKCGEECGHEWVTDPETSTAICSICGIEKPEEETEEECAHEWIRNPITLFVTCSICGEINIDYVEEDECPDGGFHIYDLNEDGTGYVCVLCGAEKETLDILDVTLEMYLTAFGNISLLAAESPYDNYEKSTLPKTVDDLLNYGSKNLYIQSLADLWVIWDLSKKTDFEGFTIRFLRRTTGANQSTNVWNLRGAKTTTLKPGDTLYFDGFGDKKTPFRGTLMSDYSGGLIYQTDTPFFQYLSTDATVKDMDINGKITAKTEDGKPDGKPLPRGVLAGVLVKDKDSKKDIVTLDNVVLSGTVDAGQGAAGMVFGQVIAEDGTSLSLPYRSNELRLSSSSSTVTGFHAGGFAGETYGDVTLDIVDTGVIVNVTVNSGSTWGTSLKVGDKTINVDNVGGQLQWDTTPAGGMYVGAMEEGVLQITGSSTSYPVNVAGGGANGGFVGIAMGGTKVSTVASQANPVTVALMSGTSNGVKGRLAGGILGYYEHPESEETNQLLKLEYITVTAPIGTNTSTLGAAAGGVIGRYYRYMADPTPNTVNDTIDYITVTGSVSGYTAAGGVVGFVHGSGLRIGCAGKNSINVSGDIYSTTSSSTQYGVGGVVGLVIGQYVEIKNAKVTSRFYNNSSYNSSTYYAYWRGGVVGSVGSVDPKDEFDKNANRIAYHIEDWGRSTIIKISDVTLSPIFGWYYYSSSATYQGGVVGHALKGSMVALDGAIDVSLSFSGRYSYNYSRGMTGYIAGCQEEALIYLETNGVFKKTNSTTYEEIGNYGGLYKNRTWGENAPIISYEQGKVLGKVEQKGTKWVIDSEADMIRLAIMLNSQGRFAANCFGSTFDAQDNYANSNPNGQAAKVELLKAEYSITKSLDLKESGIYSINRNDGTGFGEVFIGKFIGDGSAKVSIELGNITTEQDYLSLFPKVGNGAEISGFTLTRTINGSTRFVGGIAGYVQGEFTARDLDLNVGITAFYTNSSYYTFANGSYVYTTSQYLGSLAGYVYSQGPTTLTIENVRVGGTLSSTYSSASYPYVHMGGLIAQYDWSTTQGTADTISTISVNGFELKSNFKLTFAGANYASGMITTINSSKSNSNKTRLSMKDIKIHDGASITMSCNTSGYSGYAVGGWLGYHWYDVIPDENVHYSIDGITIGDDGTAAAGPQFQSTYQLFGGLVDTVAGRLQLKNINIQNGMFRNNGSRDRVGLLFRVGIDALIEIDGYTIAGRSIGEMYNADGSVQAPSNSGKVQLQGCSGGSFDEIVAYNIGSAENANSETNNDYRTGGIVNIIYDGFADGTSAQHRVYQNRLLTSKNDRRSRYYYNLFGYSFEEEGDYLDADGLLASTGTTVKSARQLMIWHMSQYMNTSIQRFLYPYFDDGNGTKVSPRNTSTRFEGNIDLKMVSYYPTSVEAGTYTFADNATVTFYGQEITTAATPYMTPSTDQKQHYMLHGGLFLSKQGEVTVQAEQPAPPDDGAVQVNFLTLKGSISNLTVDQENTRNSVVSDTMSGNLSNTGALFCRDIKDKKNIYHIRLDGLYVADYDKTTAGAADDPTGLLLAIVKDDTTLDISWVETTGYEKINVEKAASALIGLVGNPKASKISIEFRNMKLDSRKSSNVFKYASLIDENYYVEDTEKPSEDIRRIRYLFTEAAFLGTKGEKYYPFGNWTSGDKTDLTKKYGINNYEKMKSYVTLGYELGEYIEYWDVDYGPETYNGEDNPTYTMLPFIASLTWTEANIEDLYIPYVHTRKRYETGKTDKDENPEFRYDGHEGTKDIEVNPKNVAIDKGCGTYEDPYIINNKKQLLALARYLQNENDYKYLGGWQIHKFEIGRKTSSNDDTIDETKICDKSHKEDKWADGSDWDLVTYPTTCDANGNVKLPDGFPTKDELCQAYYMITADIDLSDMRNATDRQIAEDFVGLGTSEIPFRGVIIGQLRTDVEAGKENRYTLTLPRKTYWTAAVSDVNCGLIQYALGAVVKDLRIEGAAKNDEKHEKTGVAKANNKAAGVMAIVLGGDNIIDNVAVKLDVVLDGKSCNAGAYAGIVEQGSLILRNLHEDAASGFRVGNWDAQNKALTLFTMATLSNYDYVSGLVGKVEDGCVIYDDNFDGMSKYTKEVNGHEPSVLAHDATEIDGIYYNNNVITGNMTQQLPISKHYDIIVKSYLDDESANDGTTDNRIKVTKADGTGVWAGKEVYTATVTNSSQLQIVSMVINSDAFSIYDQGGYKVGAACRKAKYDDIGKGNTYADGSDFHAATREDDKINYYPYLYQYFNFDGVGGYKDTQKEYPVTRDGKTVQVLTSKLNMADSQIDAVMNYKLVGKDQNGETKVYNLAQYCRGFRGIGATYGMMETKNTTSPNSYGDYDELKEDSFYSDFRANFDGDNAIIQMNYDRTYDKEIHTAALFNDLLDRKVAGKNYYTIENMVVRGSVTTNPYGENCDGDQNYPNRTAAIVGMMCRPWKLSNITVEEMKIDSMGHAAGIVAWIDPISVAADIKAVPKNNEYEFIECRIGEGTTVWAYGGSVGGVIGVVTQNAAFTTIFGPLTINLIRCGIEGTASKPVDIMVKKRTKDPADGGSQYYYNIQRGAGRSGGFIGYVGRKNPNAPIPNVSVVIADLAKDETSYTGNKTSKVTHANIIGAYSTGGLIGTYEVNETTSTNLLHIKSAVVEECVIEGTRGNYYGVSGTGTGNYATYYDNYYTYGVGGLVGELRGYAFTLNPGDQQVKVIKTNIVSSEITGGRGYGMFAGGIVGCLRARTALFENVEVSEDLDPNHPELDLGGQTYMIKSGESDAGGVVGFVSYLSSQQTNQTVTMNNVTVKNMKILSDRRDTKTMADDAFRNTNSNTSSGYAGGLIGTNQVTLTVNGATVTNCMITTDMYSAGGIVGIHQDGYNNSYRYVWSTTLRNITVKDSIIGLNNVYRMTQSQGEYGAAGGIYGTIYGSSSRVSGTPTDYYRQRLEDAEVSNCWIYGSVTGGVLGYGYNYMLMHSNGYNLTNDNPNKEHSVRVHDNKIYGQVVGGVMGYCGSATELYFTGTKVYKNRLQGYGNGTNIAQVGGFVGKAYSSSSYTLNYYLDNLSIEENHILAGSAETNKNICVGGLMGLSSWYNCYIYEPVLKNNLIGFSETSHGAALRQAGAGTATLQTLFNETDGEIGGTNVTRKVQLLGGTSASSLAGRDMPTVDDIKKNTIGYYGARIGSLIGYYDLSGAYIYGHTYILAPKITYDKDQLSTPVRPVLDVGSNLQTTTVANGTLLQSTYGYRRNVHVIYHEPESTASDHAKIWNKPTIQDVPNTVAVPDGSQWKYLFDGIDYTKVVQTYQKAQTTETDVFKYLDAYHLSLTADPGEGFLYNVEQTYQNLYEDKTENGTQIPGIYIKRLQLKEGDFLPVIVLDTQYGMPDQLLKGVIGALTGVGGIYNYDTNNTATNSQDYYYANGTGYSTAKGGMGAVTQITARAMKIDRYTGAISDITSSTNTPSLNPVQNSSSKKWTVSYKHYDDDGLDVDTDSGDRVRDQTFTLLTITYSWTNSYSQGNQSAIRSKTIHIPVFVEERLIIDSHMKIIEGLEYDVKKAKDEGLYAQVNVANDSSYTLYMEYIYNDVRKKYTGTRIDKRIGTKTITNDGYKNSGFPIGTKLTLIDVDDDNKVYYYEVTADTADDLIGFHLFKDENNQSYQSKPISGTGKGSGFTEVGETDPWITKDMDQWTQNSDGSWTPGTPVEYEYTNVAVERFLLTVDISDVDEKHLIGKEIRLVDYSLELGTTLSARTTLQEHTVLQTIIQPGVKISFRNKGATEGDEKTYIQGSLSASEGDCYVDIWATIQITADPAYWISVGRQNELSVIDSANHNKYLELQVYLTEKGGNQVLFPTVTYASIEGQRTLPAQNVVAEGVANVVDKQYLDPYYYTPNVFFYKDGKLQFQLNDLSKIIEAEEAKAAEENNRAVNYNIYWADYVRLDFRNADMSNLSLSEYDMHVDLLRVENSEYPIGGERLDDYNATLPAVAKEDLACALEAQDLMQLGINTYNSQTSMPHTIDAKFKMDFNNVMSGNDTTDREKLTGKHYTVAYRILEKQYVNGRPQYRPYNGDQLDLKLVNDPNGALTPSKTSAGDKFWYLDYRFSWNEIKYGTTVANGAEEQKGGVIVRDLQLTVKNASAMNLSNYKVQVIVYVSDDNGSGQPVQKIQEITLNEVTSLTDFYVFTVAKLKTDLDY